MLSPFLALPLLPPRPDVYARQHSLTRQADCLCVRCVARPCLCVCVGRTRRCSQALSTCSPFLPPSVPLARSCPRAPRLRSINPSSPLPPPDRLSAHPLSFFECASGPRLRSCFPVLLSSSAFPPPVCARRAHTTLVFSTLSPSLASNNGRVACGVVGRGGREVVVERWWVVGERTALAHGESRKHAFGELRLLPTAAASLMTLVRVSPPCVPTPRLLSYVTLLVPRTPPSVNGTASHGIRAHDFPLIKRVLCKLN